MLNTEKSLVVSNIIITLHSLNKKNSKDMRQVETDSYLVIDVIGGLDVYSDDVYLCSLHNKTLNDFSYTDNGGISGIITKPLVLINSLLSNNNSCSDLTFGIKFPNIDNKS